MTSTTTTIIQRCGTTIDAGLTPARVVLEVPVVEAENWHMMVLIWGMVVGGCKQSQQRQQQQQAITRRITLRTKVTF